MKITKWHPIFALMVALNTTIVPGLLVNQKIRPAAAQTIFEDIKEHWARDCIQGLIEREIISGYYEDGTFRPNSPMTRAEFAATIARAFPNAELVREEINFVDIPTDFWAADAIQKAYRTGFLSGYLAKTFNPTLEIDRASVLMSLVKGLNYQAKELEIENLNGIFEDAAEIPEGALEAIAAATERGIVVNYPDVKKLAPTREATRAEVAGFLCQALANPAGTNEVIVSNIPREYIAQIGGENSPIASENSPPSTPSPTPTYNAVETVRVENVLAEVAYEKDNNTDEGTNFRLKMVRDGETVVEEMLFRSGGVRGELLDLQLQDLDGDKELEVLIDFAATNSRIPKGSYSFIFDPVLGATETRYQKVEHYWGDFNYDLTDMDEDEILEFKGVDGRFANAFASYTRDSFLPLRIWQYRQGKMVEVTKDFPIEVNTKASELWQELNRRIAANEEVKGILASYIANKYLVGGEETVWKLVEKLYQGSDRESYFASVRQFLLANGYSQNENINPPPTRQIPAATSPQIRPDQEKDTAETGETNSENPATTPINNSETNPVENLREELEKTISENSSTTPINNSEADSQENAPEAEEMEETVVENIPPTNNSETDLVENAPEAEMEEAVIENIPPINNSEADSLENAPEAEMEETVLENLPPLMENVPEAEEARDEENLEVSPNAETGERTATVLEEKPEETEVVEETDKVAIAPQLVRSLSDGENNSVLSLAISIDGEILASSSGKEITLWELETGELLRTMSGHGGEVRTLAISPDGEAVASGSGDGTIRFWNVETGELLDTISDAGWVTAVGFSDRGDKLLSSANGRSLQVWDVWRGRSLYSLNGIGPMAFARNGNLAATGGGRRAIRLWDVPGAQLLRNIAIPSSEEGATAIALTEDGKTLVHAISENSRIFVWNLEAGEIRHTLDGHEGEIDAIVISPDGKLLASSSADGTIVLWDLDSGEMLKTIEGGGAIVFSPDSETLIGVGGDNKIQVWRIYAP
ncbi:MAG: S-layer homology domain-containing protein [Cyanobacteriota bacterium]|nr:S-layer homology domain-containing protein [Cyanobacteriota bacterium]